MSVHADKRGAPSGPVPFCSPIPLSRHLRTSDPVIIRFASGDQRRMTVSSWPASRSRRMARMPRALSRVSVGLVTTAGAMAIIAGIDLVAEDQEVPQEGVGVQQQARLTFLIRQDDPLLPG
jgi:hypothetical protein